MKVIEHTWWRLFKKCVVRTKLDIYVFIAGNIKQQVMENKWNKLSYDIG